MKKSLIIACDGEAASGKSTGAKLISKKYNLLLINTGLFYRYASKLILKKRPKKIEVFLKKELNKVSYKTISKQNLYSQDVSNYVGILAKNKKVRKIIEILQNKIIKDNHRICLEGRDIASKVLKIKPKYDVAFYFKCSLQVAAYRRWLDLKKSVPLKEVKKSLKIRTNLDKKRKNSPLIKVKDAILVRSDHLNKQQVLTKMSKTIDQALKN